MSLETLHSIEEFFIVGLGVALLVLSHILGEREVLRFPAAVTLALSGILALVWQMPDLIEVPSNLQLPFAVAEVQFFAAISIAITLFALDVFVGQAQSLAKAEEALARQSAELERAVAVQQLAAIVQSSDDAIIGQDLDGKIMSWNPGAEKIFGYLATEVTGSSISLLVPEDKDEEATDVLERARTGEHIQNLETVRLAKGPKRVDVSSTISPIRDANGTITGISWIARDITERKRAEELRKLALLDELTGLNNRRGFMHLAQHQLSVARRENKHMTLLFIDLNNLKVINDNFGHKEGDRAIADAGAILKDTFRESDVVARVGGDEFCVLMTSETGAPVDTDIPLARLQTTLELHNASGQRPYKVALAFGMAKFDPEQPIPIEELMQLADIKMYEQKMSSANRARILVADSDPEVRTHAETAFANRYEVITAHDGAEVIRRATLERPDLIVLDYFLPDMQGADVARRLRQAPPTTLIPIIMVGAAADGNAEVESLKAGVDDYVTKPWDEEALKVRMDNLLKRTARR